MTDQHQTWAYTLGAQHAARPQRIIKTPDDWKQWGPIVDGTTLIDDWGWAFQWAHHTWCSTTNDDDRTTEHLDYPVEVVWVPSDRDLLHWPEETP